MWEAIRRAIGNNPIAVGLHGDGDKRLDVDQFMLPDGRVFRTQEAHDYLKGACHHLGDESLAERVFGENHAAGVKAKENNGWKLTIAGFLDDVQKACMEHRHGGLWNAMGYDTRDVVSIDMKACYPASFQGEGETKPYFKRFGHPTHCMARMAIKKRYWCVQHLCWPKG